MIRHKSLSPRTAPRLSAMLVFGAAVLMTASACNSTDETQPTPVPTTVAAANNVDNQTATVGEDTDTPMSVVVRDQNNDPVANTPVTWTVTGGGGAVGSATTNTNASGVATTSFTLGTTAGPNTVRAALSTGTAVTITATGVADAPSSATTTSGGTQVIASGNVSAPLVVTVRDQYGNAVSGATVVWTSVSGGLNITSSTTNANGETQATLTPAIAGIHLVIATVGAASATFTITAS